MTKLILSLILATATLLAQTTINGGRTITGAFDASGAATTKPVKTGTADPATCGIGELFYRTDTATLKHCSATNTWTAVGGGGADVGYDVGETSVIVLREDFFSGSTGTSSPNAGSNNFYTALLQGGSASGATGDENHPGVFTAVSNATNANSGVVFNPGAPSYGYLHYDSVNNLDWTLTYIMKLGSTSNARVWLGLGTGTSSPTPDRFLGFRYDTSPGYADDTKNGGSGSWVVQTCNGTTTCADGSGTSVVVNVVPTTNWVKFQTIKSGSTYTFKIDGTTRATVCPSGCDTTITAQGQGLWPQMNLAFEAGGSVTHSIDFMYFRLSGLTR